jgi:hypothetical protein
MIMLISSNASHSFAFLCIEIVHTLLSNRVPLDPVYISSGNNLNAFNLTEAIHEVHGLLPSPMIPSLITSFAGNFAAFYQGQNIESPAAPAREVWINLLLEILCIFFVFMLLIGIRF